MLAGFGVTAESVGLMEITVQTFIFVSGTRSRGAEISKRSLSEWREAPLRKGLQSDPGPSHQGLESQMEMSLFVSAILGGRLSVHLCPPYPTAIRKDRTPTPCHGGPWGALPLVASRERAVVALSAGVPPASCHTPTHVT